MRRAWLVIGLMAIFGCDGFRDLFTAHADIAAKAAGQELTAQRLAEIMGKTKGVQITREAADFVATVWINYTLFSQALVQGKNLSDSASVAETMWPQIATIKGDRWFDTVLTRRLQLSATGADSFYSAGQLRLVQHILYALPQDAGGAERETVRQKAQASLARLRNGADFGAIALVESQDFQSGRDSGFLPPSPRGAFVTSVDSAIWSLPPGGLSGLVESPYGFHIIKRPALETVKGRIQTYLEAKETAQLDSLYRDSVATARKLELSSSAVALMRAALADPEPQRNSGKKIATFRGGAFTVADFLRWLDELPPQFVGQLRQATDDQMKDIVTFFSQNTILLQQADSAGVELTPVEWASLQNQHRAEIDTIRASLGLGHEITDSSVSEGERAKLAALRLDAYFNDLVAGTARVRRMPATLSAWLRERMSFRLNAAGLARALELAAATQKADSAAADSAAAADSVGRATPPPPLDTSAQGGQP